ncbi:MAG: hypothetical protein ACK58L_19210 [Planctomycetota bacterium]
MERLHNRQLLASLVVNSLADNTQRDTVLTLREAINIVNGQKQSADHPLTAAEQRQISGKLGVNDTIQFARSLTQRGPAMLRLSQIGNVVEGNTALAISRAVTIRGPATEGITLAGPGRKGDLRLFLVQTGAALTLEGMTIKGGASDSEGGSLYVSNGATVTLKNCTITECYAHVAGGAVFNFGTLNVSGSTFSMNESRLGGALINYGQANLTGSTLTKNRAFDGGAIHGGGGDAYGGSASLVDCVLSENSAVGRGGGIHLNYSGATLTRCTLIGNVAYDGGGYSGFGGWVTFDQSTIADNTATNDGGGILNLVGNISVHAGGGDAAGSVILNRTRLTDNSASSGGGIYNEDSAALTDCHIAGNHALFGGGIYHDVGNTFMRYNRRDYYYGRLQIAGTTFANNSAADGGAIHANGSAVIQSCLFKANSGSPGAAVYNDLGTTTLNACTFTDNDTANGPDLYNFRGVVTSDGATVKLSPSSKKVAASSPPIGTETIGPDGTKYIFANVSGQRGIYRIFPGTTELRILAEDVLEYRISPNGDVYWLNDRRELYRSQAGYAGTLLGTDVDSFGMDQNGTVYQISNQITPGNFARYASLTSPSLDLPLPPADHLYCVDPPSEADVVRALAITSRDRGFPDDDGTWIDLDPNSPIHNVRIVVEPINDAIDAPRYFPNIGLAQMHVCQYKCTVDYETQEDWYSMAVVYIDRNHLHRYEPGTNASVFAPHRVDDARGTTSPTLVAARPYPLLDQYGDHIYDKAQSLTEASNGTLYRLGGDFDGYHKIGKAPGPLILWRLLPGASWRTLFRVFQYAVTDDSTVYVLDESRNLRYQLAGSLQWTTLATAVQSFVKAPDQTISALLENGQVLQWRSRATAPVVLDTGVKQISMAPNGSLFGWKGQQLKHYQRDGSAVVLDRDVRSFAMNSDGVGYVLNSRGLLRKLSSGSTWTTLDSRVSSFTLMATGNLYVLNLQKQLKRLTSRDHWTVLHNDVKSYVVSPNAFQMVYVVTTQRELKRLEASTEWYSLSRGITSLSIDTDGVVQARDIRGHKSLFYSFHTAPVLDPVEGEASDIFCTDVPSDDQVLWVAGLTGQTGLRVVITPLADQLDSPRIFPSGGPNHLHHCHYRCDLFDARGRKLGLSVYLDLDHLVRWAGGLSSFDSRFAKR